MIDKMYIKIRVNRVSNYKCVIYILELCVNVIKAMVSFIQWGKKDREIIIDFDKFLRVIVRIFLVILFNVLNR